MIGFWAQIPDYRHIHSVIIGKLAYVKLCDVMIGLRTFQIFSPAVWCDAKLCEV